LLAIPANILILRALSDGPKQQAILRREAGSPAQTTLRGLLARMIDTGIVVRHRRNRFPGVLEYELGGAGLDLLFVAEVMEQWLGDAPDGALSVGSSSAKAAIKALAEGWSTTILRALAAGPLSLTELDRVITALSYPSLERRLGAMRLAGQIEAHAGNARGTPYAVTDWLRRGVAPLAAAARWERRHLPQTTAPIGRQDVEAAFLLAIPLMRLPSQISGSCRMGVSLSNGKQQRLGGVMVTVEEGRTTSCSTQLQGHPDAWALGSPAAWLSAVIEQDGAGLELGGDGRLARILIDGLHQALFGAAVPS
jgi:DNA-binding HxlR family transcriptional regulator